VKRAHTHKPTNFKAVAASSFSLFGQEPSEFRDLIIQSALLSVCLKHSEGVHRDDLEEQAASLPGLNGDKKRLVSGIVDRLFQLRDLRKDSESGLIHAREELLEEIRIQQTLYFEEEKELEREVRQFLKDKGKITPTDDDVDAVIDALGAVLMEVAHNTASSLERYASDTSTEKLRDKLESLHILLDSLGIPDDLRRRSIIDQLADLASSSPASKKLFAGQLFYLLTDLNTSQLIRAFSARQGIEIVLDASVAIPILCGLRYEPAEGVENRLAYDVYSLAADHGISLSIPEMYIEEAAVHLMKAEESYGPILRDSFDPDLTESENAYVSHYAQTVESGDTIQFMNT